MRGSLKKKKKRPSFPVAHIQGDPRGKRPGRRYCKHCFQSELVLYQLYDN